MLAMAKRCGGHRTTPPWHKTVHVGIHADISATRLVTALAILVLMAAAAWSPVLANSLQNSVKVYWDGKVDEQLAQTLDARLERVGEYISSWVGRDGFSETSIIRVRPGNGYAVQVQREYFDLFGGLVFKLRTVENDPASTQIARLTELAGAEMLRFAASPEHESATLLSTRQYNSLSVLLGVGFLNLVANEALHDKALTSWGIAHDLRLAAQAGHLPTWIDAGRVLAMSPAGTDVEVARAVAVSAAFFLLDRYGKDDAVRLLALSTSTPENALFRTVYGKDKAELEAQWLEYYGIR